MRRLRQKVEVDPNRPVHLQTVRGVGYRLIATTPPPAGATATETPPGETATTTPSTKPEAPGD
jgi:hypothetical protein